MRNALLEATNFAATTAAMATTSTRLGIADDAKQHRGDLAQVVRVAVLSPKESLTSGR